MDVPDVNSGDLITLQKRQCRNGYEYREGIKYARKPKAKESSEQANLMPLSWIPKIRRSNSLSKKARNVALSPMTS